MSACDGKSCPLSIHVTVSLHPALPRCLALLLRSTGGLIRVAVTAGVVALDLGLEVPQDHFWAVVVLILHKYSRLHHRWTLGAINDPSTVANIVN